MNSIAPWAVFYSFLVLSFVVILDEVFRFDVRTIFFFVGGVLGIASMQFSLRYFFKHLKEQSEVTIADSIVYHEAKEVLMGVVFILIGLGGYYFLASVMGYPPNSTVLWIAGFAIGMLILDWVLLKIRVVKGWYGYNAMEAMEIVRFTLSRNSDDSGTGGRKLLRNQVTERASQTDEISGTVPDVTP